MVPTLPGEASSVLPRPPASARSQSNGNSTLTSRAGLGSVSEVAQHEGLQFAGQALIERAARAGRPAEERRSRRARPCRPRARVGVRVLVWVAAQYVGQEPCQTVPGRCSRAQRITGSRMPCTMIARSSPASARIVAVTIVSRRPMISSSGASPCEVGRRQFLHAAELALHEAQLHGAHERRLVGHPRVEGPDRRPRALRHRRHGGAVDAVALQQLLGRIEQSVRTWRGCGLAAAGARRRP